MGDKQEEMVLRHDRHLDTLTTSIQTLTDSVGTTNRKLDDVLDVMNTQNVLIERMNNLDENLKESFMRVHKKINHIENAQNTDGCAVLQVQSQKIKDMCRTQDQLHDDVRSIEDILSTYVSGSVVKWGIGIIISYSIIFGTYVVQTLHTVESDLRVHITDTDGVKSDVKRRIQKLEDW